MQTFPASETEPSLLSGSKQENPQRGFLHRTIAYAPQPSAAELYRVLVEGVTSFTADIVMPSLQPADRYYYPNYTPCGEPRLTDEHPDRPQPALHQGVFAGETRSSHDLVGSPPATTTPFSRGFGGFAGSSSTLLHTSFPLHQDRWTLHAHTRAPLLSSSFILKPPTSPLVHSSNPGVDTDGSSDESPHPSSSADPIDISFTERRSRRKSLPPYALSTFQFSPTNPSLARHQTFDSSHNHPPWADPISPTTARQTHRISSLGTPVPDLPFGSFVGSYEESILNGRMSTTPSKPLNFLAQIGVLGLGKCKQSLRCPTHVTLPFPAYFYSVGDYDSPSPYVGQIDLDSTLGCSSPRGRKSPPGVGGSYRIPQRGQLQIVIKNPNKTAVKLFLVPYDLRDMEPGSKTFIRQKSYSVGEDPAGESFNAPKLRRAKEKDSLRYLIHLHIVCPSRGRYYLFRSIRVVFANRVPDGKERLRNEILWPEPKYSPWKAETSSAAATPAGSLKEARRRSLGLYGVSAMGLDGTGRDDGGGRMGGYEKLDLSAAVRMGEGRGLLARRLKELEVQAEKGKEN
jgi:hypothetical protein